MLPRKIFENLYAVNGYFNAFRIIFTQIVFKFFDPNSECFAEYDTFCSHIFNYACGVKLIAIKEVRNSRKIACIKNIFENGWWEDAYPSSYPSGSAPDHKLQKPSKESSII